MNFILDDAMDDLMFNIELYIEYYLAFYFLLCIPICISYLLFYRKVVHLKESRTLTTEKIKEIIILSTVWPIIALFFLIAKVKSLFDTFFTKAATWINR